MSVTQVGSTEPEAVNTALGDARSVLLLGSGEDAVAESCASLIGSIDPASANLLCVTLEDTPDQHLEKLRAQFGDLPAETGVIAVGETTRSAAGTQATGPGPAAVSVDSVADPSDLTGIAMALGAYLDAWEDGDATPAVCFDSITSLLFHAEEDRVFRFLHSTTGRLRDIGAVAHYHLNPEAHDRATINAFSALFDAVVEVDGQADVTVRKRR